MVAGEIVGNALHLRSVSKGVVKRSAHRIVTERNAVQMDAVGSAEFAWERRSAPTVCARRPDVLPSVVVKCADRMGAADCAGPVSPVRFVPFREHAWAGAVPRIAPGSNVVMTAAEDPVEVAARV